MGGDVRIQFKCWQCGGVVYELPGEAHAVRFQTRCVACQELNAVDYAWPAARVEIVEVGGPTADAVPAPPAGKDAP